MTQVSPAARAGSAAAAFAALDAAELDWLLPRAAGDDDGGDVDVLVSDAGAALAALRRVGFVPVAARGHGSHRFAHGFDAASGRWTVFDVVTRLDLGALHEHRTGLAAGVLRRRDRTAQPPRPSVEDAPWLLALHLALRGRPPSSARLAELRQGFAAGAPIEGSAGPVAVLASARCAEAAEQVRTLALTGATDTELAAALSQLGAAYRRGAGPTSAVRALCARVLQHCPVRAGPGLSLAVIGPDGAGKTTLLESLGASLPMPSRYVYMGVWRTGEAERWVRVLPGARLLLRLLRLLLAAARTGWTRAWGGVVLLDRFTLDAALPSDELDRRGRISAVLVQRTAPVPDRIILLDGPPELMFARKGEHGVAELSRRRAAYLGMAERFPQMVVVDATQPAEAVRRQVSAIVVSDLLRRGSPDA